MNGAANRVGNTELELIVLRPRLFLFVLQQFQQNSILSRFQFNRNTVLIELHAALVFFPRELEFPVQPELPGIRSSQTELDLLIDR